MMSFGPKRNTLGAVVAPALVWLAPQTVMSPDESFYHLPLPAQWLAGLHEGDVVRFNDARRKKRRLTVVEVKEIGCVASSNDRAFLVSGMPIWLQGQLRLTVHHIPQPAFQTLAYQL